MGELVCVTLAVNGRAERLEVPLTETLLTTLRERLFLTGAKRGCNQGVCGACTVLADEVPVRACLSLAANCEGIAIRTIEGCDGDPIIGALQEAFVVCGGLQCGFCTPGMLIAARALLAVDPDPSAAAIRTALSGNLCRCTGYVKILEAVRHAAREAGR